MSSRNSENFQDLSRGQLISRLLSEGSAESAWVVLYKQAVAERLGLNSTDQRCLDLIKTGPTTPGDIARLTNLTTGAVTSVLDRLESCGFVKREHDSEDRRRVIVRADPEKVLCEVAPLFGCLEEAFIELCLEYSDDQLRFLIEHFRKAQAVLREATERLRREGIELSQPLLAT